MNKSIYIILNCCIVLFLSCSTISFSEEGTEKMYQIKTPANYVYDNDMLEVRVDNIRDRGTRVFFVSILPFIMTFGAIGGVILIPIGVFLWSISNKNTDFLIRGRSLVYGGVALLIICKIVYPFIFPQTQIL